MKAVMAILVSVFAGCGGSHGDPVTLELSVPEPMAVAAHVEVTTRPEATKVLATAERLTFLLVLPSTGPLVPTAVVERDGVLTTCRVGYSDDVPGEEDWVSFAGTCAAGRVKVR